ncbi:hypothetical protein KEM55_008863, partial [Ascosphaera atra]
MSSDLLNGYHTAWSSPDPHAALKLSQQAPAFLRSQSSSSSFFPFSLFKSSDTPQLWLSYEKLFLACLRTGDDASATECLTQLTRRFGPANERVMGLRGLYEEATAADQSALQEVLSGYERVLRKNPLNIPIAKRRIALLRYLNRPSEAVKALADFVDSVPTDAEAWVELSDLYHSLGMVSQAIFCLEEALLIAPNAWN